MFALLKYFSHMLNLAKYPTRTSTVQVLSQAKNVTAQWQC